MYAWVIHGHGQSDVFNKIERPTPAPRPGEVRIKTIATSVNPIDYKIRNGVAQALCPPKPAILHGDIAGRIEAVGQGVQHFAQGDPVYGCIGGYGQTQGALADFAIADHRLVAHAPSSIPLAHAAALPLVTLTAWEGLDKLGKLKDKQLLVHGGTGGVGHIATQLAKARGATVTATVGSNEKAHIASQLGADHTILYHEETVEQYRGRLTDDVGFDAVFDTVGGSNIPISVQATKYNGHIACIQGRGEIDGGQLHARAISLHLVFMLIPILHKIERQRHRDILKQAATLVDQAKLKPLIATQHFTFDQVADAHAYAASEQSIGKVILTHPDHASSN